MKISDKTIIKDENYDASKKYEWLNDDIKEEDRGLNGEEISLAIIEITNGVEWENSGIKQKTESKKKSWLELKEEIEIVEGVIEIPQEFI